MADLDTTADLLALLAEPTRVRLLSLLAAHELTVAELSAATELGQSRVSTHLGRLRGAGVIRDRKVGTATYYALNEKTMPALARRVWGFVKAEVHDEVLAKDRQRWDVLGRARDKAASWPDALAGRMERHYSPGRTWESLARGLVGLIELGDVIDAGAGDGSVAQLLAPRAKSYTLVDRSERMLVAAGLRLQKLGNVKIELADLHHLPFPRPSFDTALLYNVLTEVEEPARVLQQLAHVLRPGGRLALITVAAHDHADIAEAYRQLHPGFAPAALRQLLARVGFTVERCAITSRERRPPRLEVVTAFAVRSP
jgi:ArsR family transcriptional regulator